MYGCWMQGGAGATGATTSTTSPASWVAETRWRLAAVDPDSLSDRERVDLVAAIERLKGAASATQARAVHALRTSREATAPRDAVRSVGSEVALARRESPSLGDRFVRVSRALVTQMPATMAALTAGVCSERHAVAMTHATAALSDEDRAVVDVRVGPLLGGLSVVQTDRAARRVAYELDAASVVRRMEDAVRSRRVRVRRAADGMAYLTVLGPMIEVAGAHAALQRRARAVVAGRCAEEAHEGRGVGAVAADTALAVLSGRRHGSLQPVEVHLVMTDRTLLGAGDPARAVMEPARVPEYGSVPAPVARWWLRGADEGSVWLRRLYSTPDGRDLVAMDSRRRVFTGLLRRMLVLRDDLCTTPWCGAAIAHADHATPAREGGATDFVEGNGRCVRCNHTKEAPGWRVRVARHAPRQLEVRTPLGRVYPSEPPPLLGWGSSRMHTGPGGRSRGLRRPRRPLVTSHLERRLCRLLT